MNTRFHRRNTIAALAVSLMVFSSCSSGGSSSSSRDATDTSTYAGATKADDSIDPDLEKKIRSAAKEAMGDQHLRAMLVRVTRKGENVATFALGSSMSGVQATPSMHFRNGSMAFTYISTAIARLVDDGKMTLDDKVAKWYPDYPEADKVTVKNLLNMTSGYADYVYTDEITDGMYRDPFHQWTSDELIEIGLSKPMMFAPGTNWGYSHTNYVILGKILEKVTGNPLADVLRSEVIEPMELEQTSDNAGTPAIPPPVLHTFSSERREALGVEANVPFTEETTYWNPSWTTANGAVQTTDITDWTSSIRQVGNGSLVSKTMADAQLGPHLVGFGHRDPSGKCPVCQPLTEERSYGLGVGLYGPWITQTKNFAGSGATAAYLPDDDIAIGVEVTYLPGAFDAEGNVPGASDAITTMISKIVAPDAPIPPPPGGGN